MKKQAKPIKQPTDWSWFTGLLNLVLALAEVVATYVFATQDNKVLWGVAIILGLDAAVKFTNAFIVKR
jgi:hypothetical protein